MSRRFNFLFLLLLATLVPSLSKRNKASSAQLPVIDEEPVGHTVSPVPPHPTFPPVVETAGSLPSKTSSDITAKKGKRTGKDKTRSKDGGIGAVESASSATSPPSTGDDTVTSYDDDYDGEGGQAVNTNATNTTVG
ncbi:hypothetical protein MHU86_6835 [Fragilaria crotonensis]|nr:hypothetical protein MHU86_11098 [Fragilaria crotonensis]KAI2507542.1 hypothetical protein MHU86_6835 [Fragilaria crotonensis]